MERLIKIEVTKKFIYHVQTEIVIYEFIGIPRQTYYI